MIRCITFSEGHAVLFADTWLLSLTCLYFARFQREVIEIFKHGVLSMNRCDKTLALNKYWWLVLKHSETCPIIALHNMTGSQLLVAQVIVTAWTVATKVIYKSVLSAFILILIYSSGGCNIVFPFHWRWLLWVRPKHVMFQWMLIIDYSLIAQWNIFHNHNSSILFD